MCKKVIKRILSKILNKKNYFIYNIDSLRYSKNDNLLIVRGWGFSTDTLEELSFQIPENEGKMVELKREEREDVNDLYNIPKTEKLGFEISIEVACEKNIVKLILKNKNGICYKIKIDGNNLGKYRPSQMIRHSIATIKKRGIKHGIDQLKVQKNTIWNDYDFWIYEHENYHIEEIKKEIGEFNYCPKISIVVPVYNVGEEWLRKNIESVRNQYYENWELCMADDHSPSPHIKRVLTEYAQRDPRIKIYFREKNGHISKATNSAIGLATGDFIGFMDNDDELSPAALYEYVKVINQDPETDFIYCDEDMIDLCGRRFNPFFKSAWNPKLLMGHNYITHFVMVKKDLLGKTGLLRTEVNGSQDYDFVLRATEKAKKIKHIPKILYHWRMLEGSVAENPEAKNYAYTAGKKALEDILSKHYINADVNIGENYGTYRINYLKEKEPAVSVIVVNTGHNESILQEIINQTDYKNFEILAVNYDKSHIIDKNNRVHFLYYNGLSKEELQNKLAENSRYEQLVFIDDSVIPITNKWLWELMNETVCKNTGVVGAKILDQENCVRNAGMWFEKDFKSIHYTHRGCQNDNIGFYYRLVLPLNVFSVSTECFTINKELFKQTGGFNTRLKPSLSSIDLCLRVREKGYSVVWTPYAQVKQICKINDKLSNEDLEDFFRIWDKQKCNDPYTNPYLIEKKM